MALLRVAMVQKGAVARERWNPTTMNSQSIGECLVSSASPSPSARRHSRDAPSARRAAFTMRRFVDGLGFGEDDLDLVWYSRGSFGLLQLSFHFMRREIRVHFGDSSCQRTADETETMKARSVRA